MDSAVENAEADFVMELCSPTSTLLSSRLVVEIDSNQDLPRFWV